MNAKKKAILDMIQDLEQRVQEMDAPVMVPPGERVPMQPIGLDSSGRARFRENAVVRYLLDHGGLKLSQLAAIPCGVEDYSQFMQLIGYSVTGYCKIPDALCKDEAWEAAKKLESR